MSTAILDDARRYAERGLSVIPVAGDKRPLGRWKRFQRERPHPAELLELFGRPGVAGVAVIAGRVSGRLAIMDFDRPDAYEQWREQHPALARELPTVRTGRGFHVYARSDLERIIRMDDGEYRGAGYALAPHSRHPTGIRYEWLNPLPPGELPFVEHDIFTAGHNCFRDVRCHCSDHSDLSDLSETVAEGNVTMVTVDEAVAATLPAQPGERNAKIFDLARALRFNLGMADASADQLRPIVENWHRQALPAISTKDFSETWFDFTHAWARVRHPLGQNIVDVAAASVDPAELPSAAGQYTDTDLKRMVALCHAVASANGDEGRFFLSSHDAGARLNLPQMKAYRLLGILVQDGILERSDRGNERRAARYRWKGGE